MRPKGGLAKVVPRVIFAIEPENVAASLHLCGLSADLVLDTTDGCVESHFI